MTPRNVMCFHIPEDSPPVSGKGSIFCDGHYVGEGEITMGDFQTEARTRQDQRLALIREMQEELGPALEGLSTANTVASCLYALERLETMAGALREVLEQEP